MSKGAEHLPQQSLLDWLRPDTGFRTDAAIVSTYSASAGVLASLLLSLAGHEDDPGDAGARATRVKFAKSVTQLKGRVLIAMQSGRLFSSSRSGKPIALLDRFIKDVRYDERIHGGESWHPKCAIVRYSEEGTSSGRWRFWLGSRNLTRDASWDLGLSLDGCEDETNAYAGEQIPSIAEVASRLATSAGVGETWKGHVRRLKTVHWEVPRGLVVEEIKLMLPGDHDRRFPECPDGLRRLVAVAPFLKAATSKVLGKWGYDAHRILISTYLELNRAANGKSEFFQKQGFADVRAFPSVQDEGEQDLVEPSGGTGGDVEVNRGLHAKFLWAEHMGGATLWLGSPNLTPRAWGRNAEIFARISAASRTKAASELRDGVERFAGMASPLSVSAVDDLDDADEQMEFARTEVAARLMRAEQALSDDWKRVEITAPEPPHPSNKQFTLKVAPVADDPERMTEWARTSRTVELHPQHPNCASHLIRVSLEHKNGLSINWLQSLPINDLEHDRRDQALLGEYLDDEHLLAWIYQTLNDNSEGAEGGPWDDHGPHHSVWRSGRKNLAPSLEQLLRAWVKGRSKFEAIREILKIAATRPAMAENGSAFVSFERSLDLVEQSLNRKTQS